MAGRNRVYRRTMRFTVLGSGTTVPDIERGPPGFLIETSRAAWLVDGGSGTVQRCAAAGADPRKLRGGFYSHLHPDHCADLISLCFAMRVGPPPRTEDYTVYGAQGLAEHVARLGDVWSKSMRPGGGSLNVHEVSRAQPAELWDLDLRVLTAPAQHSRNAIHYRFESEGRSVVYSGDTGPSDALIALAEGCDLLVCECAGSDERPLPGHLFPQAIRELATRSRPREIWLTHLYPHVDAPTAVEVVAASGVPTRHASDGDHWPPGSLPLDGPWRL